jgi:DNA-binding PadR family transcriptional regulator
MKPPLRYQVLEFVKEKKAVTDEEIMDFLKKSDTYSIHELNKCLMDLEILGVVSIRWVAKEKRRVEFVETPLETTRYGEG